MALFGRRWAEPGFRRTALAAALTIYGGALVLLWDARHGGVLHALRSSPKSLTLMLLAGGLLPRWPLAREATHKLLLVALPVAAAVGGTVVVYALRGATSLDAAAWATASAAAWAGAFGLLLTRSARDFANRRFDSRSEGWDADEEPPGPEIGVPAEPMMLPEERVEAPTTPARQPQGVARM